MRVSGQASGTDTRAYDGCIITCREQATKRQRVLHTRAFPEYGSQADPVLPQTFTESLAEAVATIRGWEGDWCVVSISTPTTILRDIRNNGESVWEGIQHRASGGNSSGDTPIGERTPEERYLGMVDALDLLERLPGYRHVSRQAARAYRPEALR